MVVGTCLSVASGSVTDAKPGSPPVVDEDELIEDWTLVGEELAEVPGSAGPRGSPSRYC